MKHLITGEELSPKEISALLDSARALKKNRHSSLLQGKHLALLFDKPSLRTRFSFTAAMRELGGDVIESLENTRKKEEPEDLIRVLAGYCHAVVMRTHKEEVLWRMQKVSSIPIINGLSDDHHPCQILADLLTLQETFTHLDGLKLAYIGDGNNILHSLLLLAPLMGVEIHYCCPPGRGPKEEILQRAKGAILSFKTPEEAVAGTQAIYTDVWTSMGFEGSVDETLFAGFQVNEAMLAKAAPEAIFMHCLPMEKGKEVNHTLPDSKASVIFQQSENRLHIHKALLQGVLT